ncbi:MAG: hypothetical protein DRP85_01310 [Candidatus Makaraimicrobium thalassicum]|nr:MAG: hypothetical protein DRP85_01310 [Candidatus Omnitrophota bacterium]
MGRKFRFRFCATVSDRGQIFIPKTLQDYFGIRSRDKVAFIVQDDGRVIFRKKKPGLSREKMGFSGSD